MFHLFAFNAPLDQNNRKCKRFWKLKLNPAPCINVGKCRTHSHSFIIQLWSVTLPHFEELE